MPTQATIYVVDDDRDFREALRQALAAAGHDVATFGTAAEFLERERGDERACLLLDVRLPGLMSGLALQEELARRNVALPIVFLTGFGEIPTAVRALKQGAVDFLEKPVAVDVVLQRIEEALARDDERRSAEAARDAVRARYGSLTAREREVMRRIVAGEASKVIAIDLGLSLKTIELHRQRVMRKMQASSIPALVELALQLGGEPAA